MYFLAIQYSLNVLKVSRCKCYQKALRLFLPQRTSPSAAPWALAFTAVSHLTQTMRLNVQSARANLTPTIAKWKQGRASRALCSSVQRCPCMLFTGAHGEQPLAVPSARAKLLTCSPPAATSVVRESRHFICHKCIKINRTSMGTPLFASHAHQQGIWGHLFLYVYPKDSSNLFGSRCSVKAAVAAPQAMWWVLLCLEGSASSGFLRGGEQTALHPTHHPNHRYGPLDAMCLKWCRCEYQKHVFYLIDSWQAGLLGPGPSSTLRRPQAALAAPATLHEGRRQQALAAGLEMVAAWPVQGHLGYLLVERDGAQSLWMYTLTGEESLNLCSALWHYSDFSCASRGSASL